MTAIVGEGLMAAMLEAMVETIGLNETLTALAAVVRDKADGGQCWLDLADELERLSEDV